jgi:hypothetical protein
MKYYKYLDLDFLDVSEKLKTYTINNKDKIQGFWTYLDTPKMLYLFPEIQKMFDPLNIKIKRLSLITATVSSTENGIHRDHTDCNVRINIPILNCAGSITNFYKSDAEPVKLLLPNGVPYYQIEYNKCTLVDSFCLDRPAAIRVTEPHQVIVGTTVPRISCTIEFEENIDYLLE